MKTLTLLIALCCNFLNHSLLWNNALAESSKTLKLAFLAPEGVTWSNGLSKLAAEVEQATQKRVVFKLYFGGVAGDEGDVLRKVRVGQMSGGMFTGKTLGDIAADVRVLEIPFTFQKNPEKALSVMNQMSAGFSDILEKNGFHNLGMYEVGPVYLGTTKEIKKMDDLKGLKMWTWEGDKIAEAMIKSLQLISVPLALPDVLSSLSSGIINSAYAPPLAMIALQWQNKLKYLLNFPIAYSTGALVIAKKDWMQISASDQKIIQDLAKKSIDATNLETAKENGEALKELKKIGINFVEFPASDYQQSDVLRTKVIKELKGSFFSEAILNKLQKTMDATH